LWPSRPAAWRAWRCWPLGSGCWCSRPPSTRVVLHRVLRWRRALRRVARVKFATYAGRQLVVTSTPHVMAEQFLRDQLGADAPPSGWTCATACSSVRKRPRRSSRCHGSTSPSARVGHARRRGHGRAIRLLPPHAARTHLHLHRDALPRDRRHLLTLLPLRAAVAHPHHAADATSIVRVLAICPDEGTTYRREPFLLLFSALFIELTDDIMPVAMVECRMSVFYGTTTRGIGRRWISSISSSTQAGSTRNY
jgi:hypothetical protein